MNSIFWKFSILIFVIVCVLWVSLDTPTSLVNGEGSRCSVLTLGVCQNGASVSYFGHTQRRAAKWTTNRVTDRLVRVSGDRPRRISKQVDMSWNEPTRLSSKHGPKRWSHVQVKCDQAKSAKRRLNVQIPLGAINTSGRDFKRQASRGKSWQVQSREKRLSLRFWANLERLQ